MSELENLKGEVKTTYLKTYYDEDAKLKLRELLRAGHIKVEDAAELGGFILREELIEFKRPTLVTTDIFVVKEFNEPAIKVWRLRQKLRAVWYNISRKLLCKKSK